MKYFFCQITEVNGGIEYTSAFLIKCESDDEAVEKYDSVLLGYRGDGERGDDGFIWYPDCLAAIDDGDYKEITKSDYDVMSKYITAL